MASTQRSVMRVIPALAAAFLLAAAGCAGPGGQVKQAAAPTAGPAVRDIRVTESGGKTVVVVEGTQPLSYAAVKLDNPARLAIDLPGAGLGEFTRNMPVNKGPVSFIKPVPPAEGVDKAKAVSRLEIFLTGPAGYEVTGEGNALNVIMTAAAEPPGEAVIASAPAAPAPAPKPAPKAEVKPAPAPPPPPPAPAPAAPAAPAADPPAASPAPSPAKAAGRLTGLDVVASPEGTEVIIEGDGQLEYEYFIVESKSLVVDVFGVANGISPLSRKVNDRYVRQVRIGEHFEPRKKVRVVLDLAKPAEYKLTGAGDKVVVAFGDLAKASDETLRSSLSNVVTDVYFRPLDDRSILEIVSSKDAPFQKVDSDDPNRLIIEVMGSRVAQEAQKTLDLSPLNREVTKIVSFQYRKDDQPVVRVVAQFREMVPFRIEQQGNRILVDIPRVKAAPAAAEAPGTVPATVAASTAPASPAAGIYTGRPVTLDFKDADVTDVLRLIADVSGINFVSNTDVTGKVTIKLTNVPWDQALEVILKTNKPPLTQIREGDNIVRITRVEDVRREEEERQRIQAAKFKEAVTVKKMETVQRPPVTRTYTISYAKVKDVETKLVNLLSREDTEAGIKAGSVVSDERTSTLVVTDIEERFGDIERIIHQFDTPTPAVQIEARIVTVTNSYQKDLGIQWGFNYVADQAHGNATAFEFPNRIGVGGNVGTGGEGFVVNLPAASPTAGIGIALGHIADTLSLDVRLSALEQMGQLEILSNPKVFVVQNEQAIINVGRQLPVPRTDSEGNRTVEFKDVGIKLQVKPQVTADRRVFLEVEVERSDKGEDVETTEGRQFSIDTQRAETKVLLNDGETSVIGGLFQQTKENREGGVPFFSKIPILGYLFKSKRVTDDRSELLIFLTPKIVQPL